MLCKTLQHVYRKVINRLLKNFFSYTNQFSNFDITHRESKSVTRMEVLGNVKVVCRAIVNFVIFLCFCLEWNAPTKIKIIRRLSLFYSLHHLTFSIRIKQTDFASSET